MKAYQDPTGLWRAPVAGSRPFRTRAEAQEHCDFLAPPVPVLARLWPRGVNRSIWPATWDHVDCITVVIWLVIVLSTLGFTWHKL